MKPLVLLLLLAPPGLHFQITDARGKDTSAITIEAGAADADGWRPLKFGKANGDPVLVWPFDARAKQPDGPEPIPAVVVQRGEEKALANKRAMSAVATPVVLGMATVEETARKTGFAPDALEKSFTTLASSSDPLEKGVGLLYGNRAAEAAEQLAIALKQRRRQLTRVPSEIFAVALLDGEALYRAGKFDEAAVAFRIALQQRPSDNIAAQRRADALAKAGKAEAAGR